MTRYFERLTKEELSAIAKLGGRPRSFELDLAYKDKDKIKDMYQDGVNTKIIAEAYKIDRRSVYRIIHDD